jgi:hypothetical protein
MCEVGLENRILQQQKNSARKVTKYNNYILYSSQKQQRLTLRRSTATWRIFFSFISLLNLILPHAGFL